MLRPDPIPRYCGQCGSACVIPGFTRRDPAGRNLFAVDCFGCGERGPEGITFDEAIEGWNQTPIAPGVITPDEAKDPSFEQNMDSWYDEYTGPVSRGRVARLIEVNK